MLCECGCGTQPKKRTSRFCQGHNLKLPGSPRRRGSSHPRWNHHLLISSHGYVKVRVGKGHRLADRNGYAYEHILIWWRGTAYERVPGDGEIIHHKNGDKTDNRLENLELMTRGEHNRIHLLNRGRDSNGRFLPCRT